MTMKVLTSAGLLRIAKHKLSSEEQFELGVLIEEDLSTIYQVMCDSEGQVGRTFAILEMWWNSRKTSAIATPVIISYAKLTWNSLGQTLLNTPEEVSD